MSVLAGCQQKPTPSSPGILADTTVIVASGGGGADVSFDAAPGQTVRITMTSSAPGVEPYGHLDLPDGTSEYLPKNETAKPGFNTGEFVVRAAGPYKLTVFDGSNTGGKVGVKVEAK